MSNVSPVFNGETVVVTSSDPLWFAIRVADGLNAAIILVHKDAPNQEWLRLSEFVGTGLVQLSLPVASLNGDSIGWVVQCHSATQTVAPVFVQLCQGIDDAHLRPLTRVARYDVELTASQARMITDAVKIQ